MGGNLNTANSCGSVHGLHAGVYSCRKNLNYLVGGVDSALRWAKYKKQTIQEKKQTFKVS